MWRNYLTVGFRALIKNKTYAAQMRNYTAQRRRAHITCDNSAKT